MAKVAFSKLKLVKKNDIVKIQYGEQEIEVLQYLPVNEKLELISRVINNTSDENNFANPVKVEVIGSLEIIYAYTNLSFTEKQKENPDKLYDLLEQNGIINLVISAIPETEYKFLIDGINNTIEAVYNYRNSVMGILEMMGKDYNDLDLDASKIQKKIADPENLALLRDVLTKLG